MPETEPLYFTQFKVNIEKSINDLAVMIKDNVAMKSDLEDLKKEMVTKDELEEVRKEMATQEDVREAVAPILKHIGAYEVRAKNVEDILLKDHKPRITDLEKVVYTKA